jgi:hypothetical protein
VVITQAGSSEGLGIGLSRIQATHAIVYYDELAKFVSKAGIQCASIAHDLLTWYESGKFENLIKARKETFAFPAHSYIFGWLWCTTNRLFREYWSQLTKEESGLADRMFFLLTPEKPKSLVPEKQVNYLEGLMVTKNRIEAAVKRQKFTICDDFFGDVYDIAAEMAAQFGDPRSMNLVYKLSLYFAVDLGRESIDLECIERAIDLVKYRNRAIAHVPPIEARNEEALMQKEIVHVLRQHRGKMTFRELARECHYQDYGVQKWRRFGFDPLVVAGEVFVKEEPGRRGQKKNMVCLRKWAEEDE